MQLYDLHTHTNMSDARFPLEDLIQVEREQGHILGVSDHLFCNGIYTMNDVKNYIDVIRQYPVYRGAEVNMEHRFNLPDEIDDELDYIIASVHNMPDGRGGFVPLNQYFSSRSGYIKEYNKNYSSDMNRYYLAYIIQMMEKTFSTQRRRYTGPRDGAARLRRAVRHRLPDPWEDAGWINLCKNYKSRSKSPASGVRRMSICCAGQMRPGLKFPWAATATARLQIGNLPTSSR